MKRIALLLPLVAACLNVSAQTVVERPTHYLPDGQDFVCINGTHRFTRALYGGHTAFRVETSDRPVFATYFKKDANYNLSFRLRVGESDVPLDSTSFCEARYRGGQREYILKDSRWNGGQLRISVLADADREGGIWQFQADGFSAPVSLTGRFVPTRVQRFRRSGDLGRFDRADAFEAVENAKDVQSVTLLLKNNVHGYVAVDTTTVSSDNQSELTRRYEAADAHRQQLASRITIKTPDPYFNTVGSALVTAADGAWDGQTWLHGAIGWRSKIPGWRGAYMGDFLGWPDRQRSHFDAYARSQVTNVPVTEPHLQDASNNLARGEYRWGTPMYSNGYICRTPGRNDQFHHYDMNLVYIDELLWHFQFDADTAYMRKMWPTIERHLAWEKNTWDPDGDHLYDAYCCIWASDALQYHSGAVTHSSAYNYRGNLLAARIAERIGKDPTPYRVEAEAIRKAMNNRLWLKDKGHWAEFQDMMGNKLVHENAALWSIYTAIDSETGTPEQAWQAMRYVDRKIPHIPFTYQGQRYATMSLSDWAPYEWSINNVAMAEVFHTSLAYFLAGRPETGTQLLKSNMVDFMYAGSSPGNFGQLSTLDRNTGESYRDFADVTGIGSRAFIQGLFGITPQALDGRCIIRPGFPAEWNEASIHTPYIDYSFERRDGKDVYTIRQQFRRPLQIVVRQNLGNGRYRDIEGSADSVQTISFPTVRFDEPKDEPVLVQNERIAQGAAFVTTASAKYKAEDISRYFNSNVTDIFKNEYLTPRSPYTTLSLPKQGIGDWCSTQRTADIDDSGLRQAAVNGVFEAQGVPFATPQSGKNIVYTSLWDNYPDSITLPLKGRASHAYLMMAGSTNHMQYDVTNGTVRIAYTDGTCETLELRNPDNWCPIEQDLDNDGLAFRLPAPRPYRVSLKTGIVSRTLSQAMNIETGGKSADLPADKKPALAIPGGAAQLLDIPLNPAKKLKSLTVTAVSNDVVIGLMGVTLQR